MQEPGQRNLHKKVRRHSRRQKKPHMTHYKYTNLQLHKQQIYKYTLYTNKYKIKWCKCMIGHLAEPPLAVHSEAV